MRKRFKILPCLRKSPIFQTAQCDRQRTLTLVLYMLCIRDKAWDCCFYLCCGHGDASKTDKTLNSSHAFFIIGLWGSGRRKTKNYVSNKDKKAFYSSNAACLLCLYWHDNGANSEFWKHRRWRCSRYGKPIRHYFNHNRNWQYGRFLGLRSAF